MTDVASQPLVLIDASGWLFRAYHALPPLTNAQGEPTGAVYGFAQMVRRLEHEVAPQRILVVFDAPGGSFRNEMYADYKANRDATPEDLKAQFPKIVELVKALGLPILSVPGVEADDVLGSYARAAEAAGEDVLIVTSDKDLSQLVTDHVHLLDTMKGRRMDRAGVVEKFGVPPECIIDYLALMGDTSDNIPGVPSVGPKTAAKWLNQYGSIDAIVAHAGEIKGKVGEKLRASLDQLPLSRRLTTIKTDVPLPRPLETLVHGEADTGTLAVLYGQLGFTRLLAELRGEVPAPASHAAPVADSSATDAIAATTPQPQGKTQATCVTDEVAFAALLEALGHAPLICLDTETTSLDPMQAELVGLSFAVEEGRGWYVPVAHDYVGVSQQLPRAEVLAQLKPILEDPAKPKLGQNLKYDLKVLANHGVQVAGVAHDTMLQSYVLDAAGNRHDMDTLAERYLNYRTIHFEDVAGKGKGQLTFNQVALEAAAPYSAEDADITLRLHHALYPRVCAVPSLQRVYEDIEMPLLPVLTRMERNGVKVDAALLTRISSELAGRMDALQAQAFEQAGGAFNLGSPKQLQEILYDKLKLPVLGKTPKGDPSTAESVIEQLAPLHPLPQLILDWRGLSKLRSTYADKLPGQVNPRTGRIHTNFHQAVAATGRLSSSDPNLQNIPARTAEGRRIRQAFVAEPGNALLSIDYSQIELRLMAHFSGDERLQAAFHRGLDIHRATAAEVAGVALEAVTPEQRRAAKAINFGLIYGMSAFGLARQLGIPRNEAQNYIDRFFARYPGVKRFMDGTREQARSQGYVETVFGRRLRLPEINSGSPARRQAAERAAINAPMQGTAADLIKLAMVAVQNWLEKENLQTRLIMQVHDELVLEVPDSELALVKEKLPGLMCHVAELKVPLEVGLGVGANWELAH
ncbi:MAG TPA: DNA polymerase I [Nevskiaceae bacterium]|nr:DNA polymerase I [Nevskiaceae bacterium]